MNRLLYILLGLSLFGCVQKTKDRKISFSVDMRGIENVQSVGIRGDNRPLSWNETYLLSDDNKDSIYSGTIQFETPYKNINMKFVKNGDQFELEGKQNRRVVFAPSEITEYSAVFNKE